MADYGRYEESHLLVEVRDHVATVTINRPERMNSVIPELHDGLEELLQAFNLDADVRAVILTGSGRRAFCAGADVKAMAERARQGEVRPLRAAVKTGKWLIHHFLNLEPPIIAAVNGDAVGLGSTLALMCDITVMSETARIGDTHVNVGLVAGDGGTLVWPFLIGMNRAKELLMTGRLVPAAKAGEMGLVNYVVPQEQVMEKARDLAEELAAGAPLAVRWTKASLNQHIWQQVVNTHHFSLAVEAITMASEDNKEAAKAFAEKRKPVFEGR